MAEPQGRPDGIDNLFASIEISPEQRHLLDHAELVSQEGQRFHEFFEGKKHEEVPPPDLTFTAEVARNLKANQVEARFLPGNSLETERRSRWVAYHEFDPRDLAWMLQKQMDDGLEFQTLEDLKGEFKFEITDCEVMTWGQVKDAIPLLKSKRPDLLSPSWGPDMRISNAGPRLLTQNELKYMLETCGRYTPYYRYMCEQNSSTHPLVLKSDQFGELKPFFPEGGSSADDILIPVVDNIVNPRMPVPHGRVITQQSG